MRGSPVHSRVRSTHKQKAEIAKVERSTPSRPRLSVLGLRASALWVSLLNSVPQDFNASCIASCQMKPNGRFAVFTLDF